MDNNTKSNLIVSIAFLVGGAVQLIRGKKIFAYIGIALALVFAYLVALEIIAKNRKK